jgi:hypothetical protein
MSVAATIEELALEITRSALQQQDERLGELRSRTANLLAAATIAGSFLGAQALRSGHLNAAAVCALAAYAGCIACCLFVLLRHEVALEFRGSRVLAAAAVVREELDAQGLDDSVDDAAVTRDAHAAVNTWIEQSLARNESVFARLGRYYSAAVVILGVEIAAWIISLVV